MHSEYLLCGFIMLMTTGWVSAQGKVPYDWRDAPYGNDDFNTQVHYTKDTELVCNDSRVAGIANLQVTRWITPELSILLPGDELEFETLDGTAGWYVSPDGFRLSIEVTHDRHFGIYYCMLSSSQGEEWVVKKAVNFKGAYWGNVWWRYEQATIWSLVGSTLCGAIFAVGAFLWTRFEGSSEDTNEEEADDFDAILAKLGYNNDAFLEGDYYNEGSMGSSDIQIHQSEGNHLTICPPMEQELLRESPVPPNDCAPDPYETVVEINGRVEAVGMTVMSNRDGDGGQGAVEADMKL